MCCYNVIKLLLYLVTFYLFTKSIYDMCGRIEAAFLNFQSTSRDVCNIWLFLFILNDVEVF